VAQLIPGIGPVSATRLLDAMSASAMPAQVLADFKPPSAAAADWRAFVDVFIALHDTRLSWPADVDLALRWYAPLLTQRFDDAAVRQADLEQLARIAGTYGSREQFLTELTLDPPDATSAQSGPPLLDEDYLILSTIHSAKGQEWRSVYVLNVVDGCIPSDMSTGDDEDIEEERRLLYVAMTRAKESLQLVVPQRFYVHQQTGMGDRHVYGTRSRFVSDTMLPLYEILPKPREGEVLRGPVGDVAVHIDVARKLRNAWS